MANKENKRENKPAKPKKERRFHPIRYFKEVIAELKKLTWPTRSELISHTGAVLAFVVGMAILIGVIDFVFAKGIGLIMGIGG